MSKSPVPSITLVQDLGVSGDCHSGKNLRQVHLVPMESLRQVSAKLEASAPVKAGEIGENVTTEGIDLGGLPCGTELHFGDGAVVVLTGVRDPGPGIDRCRAGLREHFLVRDQNKKVVKRLAGVMGTVKRGGEVKPGMQIKVVRSVGMEGLPIV
ncbi:hypothetical protein EYZ11_007574 [Aspergillus tanneri]|uniref:MOSC domain-containing protein n=1 Tax=Aspergillus tanneri TaxID=1220188 RepID=A0A4S3JCN4_9EURO|nr:uncharacterized protein ATNIH1004_005602 [Aspergillus tanneri]KAA8646927.1 hypothetical protein ATNIH1004_005602 [Aspergillus tanneri]THC92956.1 hypothetical protein EYZ11_007574 [Aspergillus tanneri]